MPTARKLKSGSWNCRVFSHYELLPGGGKKRIYESFTCHDPSKKGKTKCERMASEWADTRRDRGLNKTVREAVREYIDLKKGVLSPSTVNAYEKYLQTGMLDDIALINVRNLNSRQVQYWVSSLAGTYSAKYVKNVYMLFAPAVKMAEGPEFKVLLPSGRPKEVYTPTDAELAQLLDYLADDDKYELRIAVMLAAFGSLRRSEICALETSDFRKNVLTVTKAMVRDPDGIWVTKQPKTPGSARTVVLPTFVADMIDFSVPGRIIKCNPDALSNRFNRAIRFSGISNHFTIHALRHYYVSIAHLLQISDAYTMKIGGWKTDYVMKKNYRTTFSDAEKKEQEKLNNHFSELVHHDMHHEDRKAQ